MQKKAGRIPWPGLRKLQAGALRRKAAAMLLRWRRLQQVLLMGEPGFRRSVYGPWLLDTPGDRTFELCLTGYGPFVADMIGNFDREFTFLDIGANLGLFSLLADRHPLCRRALAFEPSPAIFANFERNIIRNDAHKIEAHCRAIAGEGPEAYLSFDPKHSGMSRLVLHGCKKGIRVITIGAPALDGLVGTPNTDILAKIDVEGAEHLVLSVLRQTRFYPAIRAIIIEISEQNLAGDDKAALLALLAYDGFVEQARSGPADHYDAYYVRRDAGGVTLSG